MSSTLRLDPRCLQNDQKVGAPRTWRNFIEAGLALAKRACRTRKGGEEAMIYGVLDWIAKPAGASRRASLRKLPDIYNILLPGDTLRGPFLASIGARRGRTEVHA